MDLSLSSGSMRGGGSVNRDDQVKVEPKGVSVLDVHGVSVAGPRPHVPGVDVDLDESSPKSSVLATCPVRGGLPPGPSRASVEDLGAG